jgi:hypothetical protein
MPLSVKADPRLKAAVLAMRAGDRTLRADINRATKDTIGPVWTRAVLAHASTDLDRAVIAKGARIKPGNPPAAVAATSTRRLRGGLVPAVEWAAYEFGGTPAKVSTYQRTSPKGRQHKVTRHTARQLPAHTGKGRVALPAFADIAPRAVSLWVQLIVKRYASALDGGR